MPVIERALTALKPWDGQPSTAPNEVRSTPNSTNLSARRLLLPSRVTLRLVHQVGTVTGPLFTAPTKVPLLMSLTQ